MTREMVAIIGEEVVGWAKEILRHLPDDSLDLMLGSEAETLQQLTSEGSSWWLHSWLCPVDA